MPQESTWEKEYQDPKLVTREEEPQKDVLRFFKFLKKKEGVKLEKLSVLDLGSGTGRNANFLAELGNKVSGLEISHTALRISKTRAREMELDVDYQRHDIGSTYPFDDNSFDLILDITSSNSLNEVERKIYLSEASRVLKKGGHFFVKTLCKEGDKNAKTLIKNSPGPEKDTYIIKDINLVERVFTQEDFTELYSPDFEIIQLTKKTSYTRFQGQSYKRNFWLAYMKKK